MYNVEYKGGQSRHGTQAVDYMLVTMDGVELYAEMEPDPDDETATYDALKADITSQAQDAGIDVTTLHFWFD